MAADNISKFYKAFNAKYDNFGTEQEFRDFLGKADSEKMGNLYNAFSSKYDNFSSAEEMYSYLGWKPSEEEQARIDEEQKRQQAKEGRELFQKFVEGRKGEEPARSSIYDAPKETKEWLESQGVPSRPTEEVEQVEQPSEEVAVAEPQPEEQKPSREELEESRRIAHEEHDEFIKEYERRQRQYQQDLDMGKKGLPQFEANKRWLSENHNAYIEARQKIEAAEKAIGELNEAEKPKNIERIEEKKAQNRERVSEGTGVNAVTLGSGGFATYPKDVTKMGEDAKLDGANRILNETEQIYNQGSKYAPGYDGDALEKIWTAASQFAEGAIGNIDADTFTFGLASGSALAMAREAGEKSNKIISDTLESLGYTDEKVNSMLASVEEDGNKLQTLSEELDAEGKALDAMAATINDMIENGGDEEEISKYVKEYNGRVKALNDRVKNEYEPLWNNLQSNVKTYEDLMANIDTAIEQGLTDGDKALLDALQEYTDAKIKRANDVSVASKAGAGAEQSAEFMLDFILTGGFAKAGTKAAAKLTAKRLMKKMGRQEALRMAVKNPGIAERLLTDFAVSGARTAVMLPRSIQSWGENLVALNPEMEKDQFGRLNFDRTKANAAVNTALSQFIEYWSEGFGEYFGDIERAAFKKVTSLSPKVAIGKTLSEYRGSIGKFLDHGKFNGMFNEMLEEVVGSIFNAGTGWLTKDKVGDSGALKEFFAGENLATLFFSFLPMSAISARTNIKAYNKMKERYDEGVEMLNPFIESGAISREYLENFSQNLGEMTPEEATKKVVELSEMVKKGNKGHLPPSFTKGLMGYLQGTFAMRMENDVWENSQEKMDIVNAYTTAYNNPSASNAYDLNEAEQEARQRALDAGFSEDELDNDAYMLSQESVALQADEEDRADVLLQYAEAKAANAGLRAGYDNNTQKIKDETDRVIREKMDVGGKVYVTNINGEQVYITSEDVQVGPDGKATTPTGADGVVTYYKGGENEETGTIKASELGAVVPVNTDEFVSLSFKAIEDGRNAGFEEAKRTISPTGMSRTLAQNVGNTVYLNGDGNTGAYAPLKIERLTNEGEKVVVSGDSEALKGVAVSAGMDSFPGGNMLEVPVANLYPLLAKNEDKTLTVQLPEGSETANAENAMEETAEVPEPVEAVPVPEPSSYIGGEIDVVLDGKKQTVTILDVSGGNVYYELEDGQTRYLPQSEFAKAEQAAYAPETASQSPATEAEVPENQAPQSPAIAPQSEEAAEPKVVIPVDEKSGEPIYDAPDVTPEMAYDDIYQKLSEKNADKYVIGQSNAANKAVESAQKLIEQGESEKAAIDDWEIKAGEGIGAFIKRQNDARAEVDKKIAKAKDSLGELRRKADFWGELREVAEDNRNRREREAKVDMEPKSLEEAISIVLPEFVNGGGRLNLKNVKEVTGIDDESILKQGWKGVLSNDGITIDNFVHNVLAGDPRSSTFVTDEQDAINKVGEIIQYMSRGELGKLIEKNRAEEKKAEEEYVQGQIELEKQNGAISEPQEKSSIQGLENYSEDEIKDLVRAHIASLAEEVGKDGFDVKNITIIGSRSRGEARPDSDLDILVEYEGGMKEDEVFNAVNAEPLVIEGIKVDINPIRPQQSGTTQQWLDRQNDAPAEAVEPESAVAEDEDLPEVEPEQPVAKGTPVQQHPANLREAYESGNAVQIIAAEKAMADFINSSDSIVLLRNTENQAKRRRKTAEKDSAEYKTQDFIAKAVKNRLAKMDKEVLKAYDSAMKVYEDRFTAEKEALQSAIAYFEDERNTAQNLLGNVPEGTDELRVINLKNRVSSAERFLNNLNVEIKRFEEEEAEAPVVGEAAVSEPEEKPEEQPEEKPAEKAAKASTDEKIEDFGEKIGGARKDLYRSRIRDAVKLTAKDLKTLKDPDKILSRKQIISLMDKGEMAKADAQTLLALNMAVRATDDALGMKTLALTKYRDMAAAWEKGDDLAFEIKDEDIDFLLDQLSDRVKALPNIREKERASLEALFKKVYEDYKATYEALDYPAVNRSLKSAYIRPGSADGRFWVVGSPSSYRGYPFGNMLEAVAKMQQLYPEVQEAEAKNSNQGEGEKDKFGNLTVTKDESGWYRVKSRSIPGKIYLSKKFYTKKQAEQFLKDNAPALIDREQKMVDALLGSNIGMVNRQGRDYRGNKDVTPDQMLETFGFRGVEFGNWVPQAERQEYLNKTYDAIMDFCDIVGISPKAFSLGGRLGLAFGARGHSRALAHYEPMKEVINLTRMKGAGSLAHEWFHALDNYLAKQKTGNTSDMATDTKDTVREETAKAFKDFVEAMNKLDYSRRSHRAGDYWGEVWERAARLFESYVYNELGSKSVVSPLLVRKDTLFDDVVSDENSASSWPYPSIAENEQMKPFFDNLFQTIEEKVQEDGKVALAGFETAKEEGEADGEVRTYTPTVPEVNHEEYQKRLDEVAEKMRSVGPNSAEYNELVKQQEKILSEYQDAIDPKHVPTSFRTYDQLEDYFLSIGMSETSAKTNADYMRDNEAYGAYMRGRMVFVNEKNTNLEAFRDHYVHERQHHLNERGGIAKKLFDKVGGNLDMLESALSKFVGTSHAATYRFYYQFHNQPEAIADEVIAYAMGLAYYEPAFANDPKFSQLAKEIQDFINDQVNEQFEDSYRPAIQGQRYQYLNDRGRRSSGSQTSEGESGGVSDGSRRNDEGIEGDQTPRFGLDSYTPTFYSNAAKALDSIKTDKATPQQWLSMLEKSGGLKAGEDKWVGLSDWLKASDKKTITKREIAEYIAKNQIQIEETHYGEEAEKDYADAIKSYQDEYAEFVEEGKKNHEPHPYDYAIDQMIERYGDDFDMAFSRDGETITPNESWDRDGYSEAAMYFLDQRRSGNLEEIHPTRLMYTTEGLTNKREIALTVPTIEPWNTGDNVHFGDAGEGRAIAWARFGDAKDSDGHRVLVIDEIQSKRHQEGREKGYETEETKKYKSQLADAVAEARAAWQDYDKANTKVLDFLQPYKDKLNQGRMSADEYNDIVNHNPELGQLNKERSEMLDKYDRAADRQRTLERGNKNEVPAAPFEKNWHELAMKRMLRLAAEEGYDYVAWTTGDQQAERYDIGSVLYGIERKYDRDDYRQYTVNLKSGGQYNIRAEQDGSIVYSSKHDFEGRTLSEVFGKEMAAKMMSMSEMDVINGDNLRIGGEGMRGFYDEILPRFMNKYGKKWGVQVEDILLPHVEDANQIMHAVRVTPEMRESVMQGQPMFREAPETEAQQRITEAEREVTNKVLDTIEKEIGIKINRIGREQMPRGHKSDKGFYDTKTGEVTICMDNVADERDAIATIFHESVGHLGLRRLFGDRFNDAMVKIYAALDNKGRAWVNAYIKRHNLTYGDEGIIVGMEEYLSSLAESGDFKNTVWDKIKEIFQQLVDAIFGTNGFRFTDNELNYILRASYEHLKNPEWLETPEGKSVDTLLKRALGINETDTSKPTDPENTFDGNRYRDGWTGVANEDYEAEMEREINAVIMENQNADLPVKIGYDTIKKEKGIDFIPEDEDYLTMHNLSSSRAETESHNFELFYFTPLLDKVREIQQAILGDKDGKEERVEAYERVMDYMYAVSALERNAYKNKDLDPSEQRDWSGITALMGRPKDEWQDAEDDARVMIADFEREVNNDAALNELWDRLRACTDYNLDHAYKYGLITLKEYERLHGTATEPRMWEYYLPLRGFSEQTAEEEYNYSTFVGDTGSRESPVIKKMKGRVTKADNPLANLLRIAEQEIVQGNENKAKQALYRFVLHAGENTLLTEVQPWYVKDPATGKWSLAEPEPILDIHGNQIGTESLEDFEKRMDALNNLPDPLSKKGRRGLKIDHIMSNKAHRNEHMIRLKVGGNEKMIWVNGNPALAKAVNGTARKKSMEMIRRASRALSNLFTTYSLDFTAKNLIRDTIYSRVALLVKEDKEYRHQYTKNWLRNFGYGAFAFPMVQLAAQWENGKLQAKDPAKRTKREQMFIDFMTDGGQTGYTIINSVRQIKKDIERTMRRAGADKNIAMRILGFYPKFVKTLNEGFELLTRFTAYETSRDMGRSGQRAASDAKEISVNFNRRGAQSGEGVWGVIAAYLGATHYFYNAGVQGFDNYLRLFKTAPVKMTTATAGFALLGALTPMLNAALAGLFAGLGGGDGDDDDKNADWYWNLPEWVRRNNIVVGTGEWYLAIPLPVEFRAPYGLGDIAGSYMQHKVAAMNWPDFSLDVLNTAAGILPVNPIEGYTPSNRNFGDAAIRAVVPDATIFFVDWATNRDYTGRPLWKENTFNDSTPKSQGAYASTPKGIVAACQWLAEQTADKPLHIDIAPGLVRDFANNYGGGFYRAAEDVSKIFFTDAERPFRYDNIPFFSGFTGHIDEDRSNTSVTNALYEYKNNMDDVLKRLNSAAGTNDITPSMAFDDPESLPKSARVQRILEGKKYELARMYREGMNNEYVMKQHVRGEKAGQWYKSRELKRKGVESLRKEWKDLRDQWMAMPEDTQDQRIEKDAFSMKVQDAWHAYYDAQADLAQMLMNYEYDNPGEGMNQKIYKAVKDLVE